MKVIAIVRTRNEEKNIGRFIECYLTAGVDEIIVSDGGSEDNTIQIAESYPKTKVIHYTGRVEMQNGLWRNPHGEHWNFTIDQAIADGADWIIHDDADCVPNISLQMTLRLTLGLATEHGLKIANAYRIYLWGEDKYFPKLNSHGQGLYAFTPDSGVRFVEDDPNLTELVDPKIIKQAYKFEEPEVLLHYFCPDEETVEQKSRFYIDSGQIPGYLHPLESCGKLDQIKSWMVWK